jgi:metal-responsive CopG/Arc/MetJ family transcriptional regulator
MLSRTTVKLSKALCQRAGLAAEKIGYSSVEEFIEHAVEKELDRHEEETEAKEDLLRKLKGLGYLD